MRRTWLTSGFVTAAALAWYVQAQNLPQAAGETVIVNSAGMRMILFEAGTFQMGSPWDALMRQEEEVPHRVTLTRPFRMAATEVTQRQWQSLMAFNRSPQQGEDLPVTNVSWNDAQEFCRRLSEKEGVTYRLPTEAEWEYACRSGGGPSEIGHKELVVSAWYADNSEEGTHPVGSRKANARGIFDMLGNVAEWTTDVYGPYARAEVVTDPSAWGPGSGRVVRGGSWRSFPPALRCAARTGLPEPYQVPYVGLRVVLEER